MILSSLMVVIGFVLLILGANWLVDGASSLAKRFGMSDLAIGLTIVAFGTSAPELVVNSFASYQGHEAIVFGNVLGSNNFNLFIILGITALLFPISVQSNTAWKEIPLSLFIGILLYLVVNTSLISTIHVFDLLDSLLFILLFIGFLYYVYRQMRVETSGISEEIVKVKAMWLVLLLIIGGFAGLIYGGHLVVTSAVDIATELGMSEKLIGLTIVAAGTSLPELVTSVVAALRRNSDIAIGNIVGSNIFNILFILAVSGMISPISYDTRFNIDLIIYIGGTALLILFMVTGKYRSIDRWEAAVLLVGYLTYTGYLIQQEASHAM